MEKTTLQKFSDRIIIGGFIFVIISNLIIDLVLIYNGTNDNMNYGPIIVTSIFLIVYVLTEKIYKAKFFYVPESYYYVTVLFAFFSTYLGSYFNFYERFGWWDDLLHLISGILIGLVATIIVSYLIAHRFGGYKNRGDILVIIIMGLLLSFSAAVLWEFYEYTYDFLFDGNMQRGLIIEDVNSFDPTLYMRASGRFVAPDLYDTMHDLMLSTLGSIIAAVYAFNHFAIIQLKLGKE